MTAFSKEPHLLTACIDYLPIEDVLSCSLVNKPWYSACKTLAKTKGLRIHWKIGNCVLSCLFYKFYNIIMRECDRRFNGNEVREKGYLLRSSGVRESITMRRPYFHVFGKDFWSNVQALEGLSKAVRMGNSIDCTFEYIKQFQLPNKKLDCTYLDALLTDFAPIEYQQLKSAWYFETNLLNFVQMSLSINVCQVCLEMTKSELVPTCFQCLGYCGRQDWRICGICTDVLSRQRDIRNHHYLINKQATNHIRWEWGVCSYMDPRCESYSHAGQGCECRCHNYDSDEESSDSMSEDDEVYGF